MRAQTMGQHMRASQLFRVVGLWTLLLLSAQAADEADALPTLFDFLGAIADREGEWVDPLDMAALGDELPSTRVQENSSAKESAAAQAAIHANDSSSGSSSTPEVEVTE